MLKKSIVFFTLFCTVISLCAQSWQTAFNKSLEKVNTTFANGDKYKGQLYNDSFEGMGIYYWASGVYYFGDWLNGRFNGYGIYFVPEGSSLSIFVGNFINGSMSGRGAYYNNQGNLIYSGNFSNGQPTDSYPSGSNHSSNKFQTIELGNGSRYIGETKEGAANGYGICVWENGDLWFGNWVNWARGKGIHLFHNAQWILQSYSGNDFAVLASSQDQYSSGNSNQSSNLQRSSNNQRNITQSRSNIQNTNNLNNTPVGNNAFSQERVDTIFYDKDWKGVPNRSFADFYRIAVYPTNENYKKIFRDFYITGELQSTGYFISLDKYDDSRSVFEGECIGYFKNGKIAHKYTFSDGKLNGEYLTFTDDGLTHIKANFINGELSGIFTEFIDEGAFLQAEFVNGKPKDNYYIMSNSNGQLLKISFSNHQPIWESPSVSERKTQYRDGSPWQYYEKNGLLIAQTNTSTNDYGKYHRIDIIVSNYSMLPIEFDPKKDILAFSLDKKRKRKNLAVWSSDEYMKKVRRAQNRAAFAVALSEGLAAAAAGYSTSTTNTSSSYSGRSTSVGSAYALGSGGVAYGSYAGISTYSGSSYTRSTTTTYNAAAAYQAQVLSRQRIADFSDAQWNERNAIQKGYLKKNTIYPGETIQGYIHITRVKGNYVNITMKINGAEYIYDWRYRK